MISKKTKLKAKSGVKVASTLAAVAGKKVADRLVEAGDSALMKLSEKLSEGARKRKRTRRLKAVGKAVLLTGAAAATVLAGRAALKRRRK
jgi:hypothetical protein